MPTVMPSPSAPPPRASIKDVFYVTVLVVLTGIIIYDRSGGRPATAPVSPAPAPSPGVALGRAYAPQLADGYGNGWLMAAQMMEAGRPVAECQKALQDTFLESRKRTFDATVKPVFSAVLPEGAEPADAAQRARVVALWRAFAAGLKGGR